MHATSTTGCTLETAALQTALNNYLGDLQTREPAIHHSHCCLLHSSPHKLRSPSLLQKLLYGACTDGVAGTAMYCRYSGTGSFSSSCMACFCKALTRSQSSLGCTSNALSIKLSIQCMACLLLSSLALCRSHESDRIPVFALYLFPTTCIRARCVDTRYRVPTNPTRMQWSIRCHHRPEPARQFIDQSSAMAGNIVMR